MTRRKAGKILENEGRTKRKMRMTRRTLVGDDDSDIKAPTEV